MKNYLLAGVLMLFTAVISRAQSGQVDANIGIQRLTECPEIRDVKYLSNGQIVVCGLREDIFSSGTVAGYIGTYSAIDGSLLQGHLNGNARSAFACDTLGSNLAIAVCGHRDSATHLFFITTDQHYNDYALPSSFGLSSVEVFDLKTQRNGAILVAGTAEKNGENVFFVARFIYVSNGAMGLDLNFGFDGITTVAFGTNAQARALDIQSDDKIIVAGHTIAPNRSGIILRLNTNGTVDNTFNTTGYVENSLAAPNSFVEYYSVSVDANDNIFCTGATQSGGCYTAISPTGAVYSNYNFTGANVYYTSAIRNHQLYMAGPDENYFQNNNAYSCVQIVNAEDSGVAYNDTSFQAFRNSNQLVTEVDNAIFGSALQPDGKLLLCGLFNNYGFFTRLITQDATTGVYTATAQNDFSIWPNPAQQNILIKGEKISHIRIADLAGREVMQMHCAATNEQRLNVSQLLPAVYIVTINGNKTSKLVITY